MRTIETEHPADISAGTRITPEAIRSYLGGLAAKGRGTGTVQNYTNKLLTFYEELPADKRVTRGALEDWRQKLLERGYSPNTVNTYLTAVNGLLAHMDRRDLQLVDRLELRPEIQPELTRAEYLRLLGAARALDRERTYLLVKLFALTGRRENQLSSHLHLPAGGAAELSPADGSLRGAGLCHQERAAGTADADLHGDPLPQPADPGDGGEVQSPLPAEAVPGHPGGDRPQRPAAGGAGLGPDDGKRTAHRRVGCGGGGEGRVTRAARLRTRAEAYFQTVRRNMVK